PPPCPSLLSVPHPERPSEPPGSERLPEQRVRDDETLDLGRSFVDLGDARVAEVTLHVELLRVPHAAVDLHRLAVDAVGGLAGVELGHRRLARMADASV